MEPGEVSKFKLNKLLTTSTIDGTSEMPRALALAFVLLL